MWQEIHHLMNHRLPTILALIAILAFLAALAGAAFAQPATQPTLPVLSFFQPARNIPMQAALGIDTFCGPTVENDKALPPAALAAGKVAWIKVTVDAGVKSIIKAPALGPLPPNCVGVMFAIDEVNGKWPVPVLAADLKAESDDYATRYPGVKRYLSLAGDKVLSADFTKPAQAKVYLDYAQVADVFTIDFYPRNRDAGRYPDTFPGDCVKKLAALTGKPVIPWIEHNDQQLKPIGGPNRAPTPTEIQAQVDWSIANGAAGIGWFSTCEAAKYGWGVTDPAKGDSFWPLIDRTGASMQPQIDVVAKISKSLAPPKPDSIASLTAKQAELEQNQKLQADIIAQQGATIRDLQAARAASDARWLKVWTAATQPSNP
jgi:hypothetical protein